MVEFDVSADKSSIERENEGLSLTQLPAATASTSAPTDLPSVTAEYRRAANLRANKCVICVFYIPQIFVLSANDLSECFFFKYFSFLPN